MSEKENGKSILVVDDEPGIRDLLEFELKSAGYQVVTAVNGNEALERFKKDKFQLVLSDVMMPGMNGIDLLREIKKLDSYVEVIIGTGYGQVENAVRAMKLGAYDYIQKPYELDEILTVVDKAMEKHHLRKSRDEALEASRAKSEFLATMSHEIRTPLNAILGMADLLADTSLNEEQGQYIEILKRGGDNLLNLINDILDLSKIEAGHLELEEMPFDLEDLVERTVELMAMRAHQKGLELISHLLADVPKFLIGDSNRLRQVLVNLVGNAIKFTEKGEVVLEIKKGKEIDSESQKEIELIFSIRDTGIGISQDKVQSVFEPFTQADSSTTRKYGSTGLGLSISKRIAEHMGGRIWAESEEGKGSAFYFSVVLGISSMESKEITEPETQANLQKVNTLIVDDNLTNRFILREILIGWGALVTEVESGKQAIEALEEAKKRRDPYKLVLLDCRMPEMDGFSVAEKIKNDSDYKGIVVLMLSSDSRKGDVLRSREMGIASYLIKPVKRSDLLKSISLAMNHTPQIKEKRIEDREQNKTAVSSANNESLRILLVEDAVDNQILVQSYLKKTHHELVIAENGKVALEKFKEGHYDLVLMDMHMPVMDGIEATKAIRQWEREQMEKLNMRRPPARIIALTADALAGDAKKSLAAGCNSHITKPIKKDMFLKTLELF